MTGRCTVGKASAQAASIDHDKASLASLINLFYLMHRMFHRMAFFAGRNASSARRWECQDSVLNGHLPTV